MNPIAIFSVCLVVSTLSVCSGRPAEQEPVGKYRVSKSNKNDDGSYRPVKRNEGRYIHMVQPYVHVHDNRELGKYRHIPNPYDGGYGPYSGLQNPYEHDESGNYDKYTVSNAEFEIPAIRLEYGFPDHDPEGVNRKTCDLSGPQVYNKPVHNLINPSGPQISSKPMHDIIKMNSPQVTSMPMHDISGPEVTSKPVHDLSDLKSPQASSKPMHDLINLNSPQVTSKPLIDLSGSQVSSKLVQDLSGSNVASKPVHELSDLSSSEISKNPLLDPSSPEVPMKPVEDVNRGETETATEKDSEN